MAGARGSGVQLCYDYALRARVNRVIAFMETAGESNRKGQAVK